MKIYTHSFSDPDSAASVWAVRKFVPGGKTAELVFVPANWDGKGLRRTDIAVDLDADGYGLKGRRDGERQMSCFAQLMEQYAPLEIRRALHHVTNYIDMLDSEGLSMHNLIPEADSKTQRMLAATGLNAVFRAIRYAHPKDDATICARFGEILDGMVALQEEYEGARRDASDRIEEVSKNVAIVQSDNPSAVSVAFGRGYKVIIYVQGNNLGLVRENRSDFMVDHPSLREIVKAAGEEKEWFAHSAHFLYCRGSHKSPVSTPSRVDPKKLAKKAAELFG